jgi:hypothetical protein
MPKVKPGGTGSSRTPKVSTALTSRVNKGDDPPPFRSHGHLIMEVGREPDEAEQVPLPSDSTRTTVRPKGSGRRGKA